MIVAGFGVVGDGVAGNAPVVAVYDIDLATPKTKLHFGEDGEGVRDMLNAVLEEQDGVRVFDWARMGSLIAQQILDGSNAEGAGNAASFATDYHLMATVSYTQEPINRGGGLSNSKVLVGEVRVDLLLKDVRANNNQLVASAVGQARRERRASKRLGFGAAGPSTVSSLSTETLQEALDEAVREIVAQMSRHWAAAGDQPIHSERREIP